MPEVDMRDVTALVRSCALYATRVAAALNAAWFTGRVHWLRTVSQADIRFHKYRVAPRLRTDTVRRRLLLGLHAHAPFTPTESGLA
jgi:hypothetical protein